MGRASEPTCHGRPMKWDAKAGQYVCRRCGAWTTHLMEVTR
jgi:transcription initiation factor TFIIIB Brf1 subunit/transcription initiation factor TFIIB